MLPNLYGLLIALGILAAVLYMGRESKRLRLPGDLAVDMALWSVPLAVVFARLYYVAFTFQHYQYDPLSIFKIWEGGLAIYGGVLGGALGVFLLAKRRRLSFALLCDLVAPGLILAQAIGRWGNFFNGEAYGRQVVEKSLQFFPYAVKIGEDWFLAAFFLEFVWNLLGFFLLLFLRRASYKRGQGQLFLWYLFWYGLGRLVIEGTRLDSLMLGSVRVSQALSLLLMLHSGLRLTRSLGRPRQWMSILLLLASGLALVSGLQDTISGFSFALLMAMFGVQLVFYYSDLPPALLPHVEA